MLRRAPKLKKLHQQTIVITGASSGIGLATARLAAQRGANVVLSSRSESDLRQATEEIIAHSATGASRGRTKDTFGERALIRGRRYPM